MDKIEYFNQLKSLQDSSDEEIEINELRRVYPRSILEGSHPIFTTKPPNIYKPSSISLANSLVTLKEESNISSKRVSVQQNDKSTGEISTPVTQRIILEPQTAQSFVEETPQNFWQQKALQQNEYAFCQSTHIVPAKKSGDSKDSRCDTAHFKKKDSLFSDNVITFQRSTDKDPNEKSFATTLKKFSNDKTRTSSEPTSLTSNQKPQLWFSDHEILPTRNELTPSIGSVVMKNSTGITSMLRKRKRKDEAPIKLVPEDERIFAGKTFLFIPADDIAPLRRIRIAKARSYGAAWTKKWTSKITHVVVDKNLNYNHVMEYLKPIMKAESLPPGVILVNDDYPNECANFRSILDPHQKRYLVKGAVVDLNKMQLETINLASKSRKKSSQTKEITHPVQNYTLMEGCQTLERDSKSMVSSNSGTSSSGKPFVLTTEAPEYEIFGSYKEINFQKSKLKLSHQKLPDEISELAQKVKHLPIEEEDDEEDFDNRNISRDCSVDSFSDEDPVKSCQQNKWRLRKKPPKEQNFTCMKLGSKSNSDQNPNEETIHLLSEMLNHYDRIKDEWRVRAYRMAIRTLKEHSIKISSYDEAIQLPNIGHRLAQKIEEIVLTHRLQRLDSSRMEQSDHTLQIFLKIYDVGLHQASKWVAAGYKTLEDLQKRAQLTKNQRIGIEHYDDFNTRIPRSEVTALGEIVQKTVISMDPSTEVSISGSYRRGAPTCGDIDILITRPGTRSTSDLLPFLEDLVKRLTQDGFLVSALVRPNARGTGSKWHGACVLPGQKTWRRIDFLVVPITEMGAALLYFTGDDIFNRSIRLLSRKKGMRLNQHGLYSDVMRGCGQVKLNKGTLIESADEKRIFECLGVPWRPPEQRVFS